ncbi:MAG: VCBS repeat-containing protein [Acidobacteriia bacterium]|nr:VCBS repeat-containing protein [Terriglobia bacterium]
MRIKCAAALLPLIIAGCCPPLVAQNNPVPFVHHPLSPANAAPGTQGITLTLSGAGFVNGAVVNWNGAARPTSFVSSAKLTAAISISDLAASGSFPVTVTNPAPGGGASNVVLFEVTTPAATLAFTLTNTNFPNSSASPGINQPSAMAVAYSPGSPQPNLEIASGGCPAQVSCVLDHGYITTAGPNAALTLTVASPNSVATGDFNGDGLYDLLSAGTTFSVSLAQGANLFANPKDYPLPGDASPSVAPLAADFNRDGRLDLVVGRSTGAYFLAGNGDGTFAAPVAITTDPAALGSQLALGDFNGDGILDLAVCNFDLAGSTVSILLGNGDGTFLLRANYNLNLFAGQIMAVDFNGDGILDLAALDSNSSAAFVSILLGNGDGTFQPKVDYPAGTSPIAITAGDYNGDGRVDLAIADTLCLNSGCPASGAVNVLLGKGDGTLQSSLGFSTQGGPSAIASGEFLPANPPVGREGFAVANQSISTVSIFSAIPLAVNSNPLPTISSVAPAFVIQNSGALTLTIAGTNFVFGSTIMFNGQAEPTTFVSSTQLSAQIPATAAASAGAQSVVVNNPSPGGGISTVEEFFVYYASPVIASLSTTSVVAGSPGFPLTINGSNFVQGATLDFNGVVQPFTFVSSTQLTTTVAASSIATPATIAITLMNPSQGIGFSSGGASPAVNLAVLPANTQPTVGGLSPASATAGAAGFTLTITGAGFSAFSTVKFGAVPITTTGFDPQTPNVLQAPIPMSALAIAGTPLVIVTNPGGAPSVPISFIVNNPVPAETGLSPTSAAPGSGAVPLNVAGVNFNSSSVVQAGGAPLATTFVSSTSLTALLPASAMTPGATLNVAVNNPSPGGGTTSPLAFAIADFNVTAVASTSTIPAGQPASFMLAVVPAAANGSLGAPVNFTAVGMPPNANASFSPSSLPSGTKATNVTLSIATMPHSGGASPLPPRGDWPRPLFLRILAFLIAMLWFGLRAASALARRYVPQFLVVFLLLIASALAACGGSSGNYSPALNPATGTPAGTYSITVTTASGNASLTTKVTLTVR